MLLAISGASCSSGPKLYPVKGQLFYGNEPAEGAQVVFQLRDGGPDALKPSGMVQADGTFTLSTHPHGEGAPPGEYVVLVTWYPADAREQENPRNKLPERYADPSASPLKAAVQNGPTELEPIRISKK